ncbi:MAG: transposase, partial [Candidatus Cloacimonetes bacterium]|nr:transposase [Candidatus Cloacimonadota bacterium]
MRYGKNRDHDPLPQINLALLFGEKSKLPFYYRKLPGNIPDVKTVKNLLADMDFFDFKRVKLAMDRGFYSVANINELYKNHLKFLMGTKLSLKFVKTELDSAREEIRNWTNYSKKHNLYALSKTIPYGIVLDKAYRL